MDQHDGTVDVVRLKYVVGGLHRIQFWFCLDGFIKTAHDAGGSRLACTQTQADDSGPVVHVQKPCKIIYGSHLACTKTRPGNIWIPS